MNKQLVLGAIVTSLILSPLCAKAQSSVTLYGTVDLGVQYLTNTNAKHGNTVGLQSGNIAPSNWGLIGREDLGGGYAAIFRLESGINMANGANQSPTSFFNRYAYVGIDSPYGTLTFGRQYKVMFDLSIYYDPTFLAQYSTLSAGLIPQTTGISNAVKYRSPTVGGFTGIAEYSFGQEEPGHMAAGSYIAGGLEYKYSAWSTRVVYEQTRGSIGTVDMSSQLDKRFSAATKLRVGPATLFAGFLNVNGSLQLSPNGNMYWGGVFWQVTPALGLSAEVDHYQTRGDHGNPNWFALEGTYNLSKRTLLYAFAGYLDVNGGKNFTLNYADTTSPGNLNQTGVIVGIRHSF